MTVAPQIIDANINRAAEGLRVLEEYARFVASHADMSGELADIRHALCQDNPGWVDQLNARHTARDARSQETNPARSDFQSILIANFKRVTEALRVLEEYTGRSVYNRLRYRMYDIEKALVLQLLRPPIVRGVYVISNVVDVLVDAAKRGAALVQLRDKQGTKAQILASAQALMAQRHLFKSPVIINDFIDIAVLVNADGVHTGQDDIPVAHQRQILGPHRLIGRTTHHMAQGQQAVAEGADYVSVGPIWDTPSKPDRPGIGLAYLKEAGALGVPYVAIGGIDGDRVADLVPYSPPLIGIIRAVDQLDRISKLMGYEHNG